MDSIWGTAGRDWLRPGQKSGIEFGPRHDRMRDKLTVCAPFSPTKGPDFVKILEAFPSNREFNHVVTELIPQVAFQSELQLVSYHHVVICSRGSRSK